MIKTTVYLTDELKRSMAEASAMEGVSEAELIREAVQFRLSRQPRPAPRLPLVDVGPDDPTIAEHADEILAAGFGR